MGTTWRLIPVGIAVALLVLLMPTEFLSPRRRKRLTRPTVWRGRADTELHRTKAEANSEIEGHDIDDILDAIQQRRRRRGDRDIGEQLSDELLRGTWHD